MKRTAGLRHAPLQAYSPALAEDLGKGLQRGGPNYELRPPRACYPTLRSARPPPGFALTGMAGPRSGSVEQARKDYTANEWQAI